MKITIGPMGPYRPNGPTGPNGRMLLVIDMVIRILIVIAIIITIIIAIIMKSVVIIKTSITNSETCSHEEFACVFYLLDLRSSSISWLSSDTIKQRQPHMTDTSSKKNPCTTRTYPTFPWDPLYRQRQNLSPC